mgnify:FL=1|jgi:hypothetical protein|tara:strand:- start:368 stop:571 length:204 start_codon:yes stop_codon:yes gene_type:complete
MEKPDKYVVNINFDEASSAWRKNKNILKNGMYSYKKGKKVCSHINENGKKCRKRKLLNDEYCENHFY